MSAHFGCLQLVARNWCVARLADMPQCSTLAVDELSQKPLVLDIMAPVSIDVVDAAQPRARSLRELIVRHRERSWDERSKIDLSVARRPIPGGEHRTRVSRRVSHDHGVPIDTGYEIGAQFSDPSVLDIVLSLVGENLMEDTRHARVLLPHALRHSPADGGA